MISIKDIKALYAKDSTERANSLAVTICNKSKAHATSFQQAYARIEGKGSTKSERNANRKRCQKLIGHIKKEKEFEAYICAGIALKIGFRVQHHKSKDIGIICQKSFTESGFWQIWVLWSRSLINSQNENQVGPLYPESPDVLSPVPGKAEDLIIAYLCQRDKPLEGPPNLRLPAND